MAGEKVSDLEMVEAIKVITKWHEEHNTPACKILAPNDTIVVVVSGDCALCLFDWYQEHFECAEHASIKEGPSA